MMMKMMKMKKMKRKKKMKIKFDFIENNFLLYIYNIYNVKYYIFKQIKLYKINK